MKPPIKPIEPIWKDYPKPEFPNAVNGEGKPVYRKLKYVKDIAIFIKALRIYDKELLDYKQFMRQ